jgi:hypothetical protein
MCCFVVRYLRVLLRNWLFVFFILTKETIGFSVKWVPTCSICGIISYQLDILMFTAVGNQSLVYILQLWYSH